MANQVQYASLTWGMVVLVLNLCVARAFMESPSDLLEFCKDTIDIENCAHTHLNTSLSLYDMFDLMADDVSSIDALCQNASDVLGCIGPCQLEFRASVYGYLWHMCAFQRWIEWERECWTQEWKVEARQCFRRFYPHHRMENPMHGLYPVPYRVYDRATIQQGCFPSAQTAGDKCPYYQSWLFQRIVPNYYQLMGYPQGFHHVNDNIGFPGI